MTPGEAQAMEDASETVASDFEQTLAGMAEGAEFSQPLCTTAPAKMWRRLQAIRRTTAP